MDAQARVRLLVPRAGRDAVVVGADDGSVHALRAGDGRAALVAADRRQGAGDAGGGRRRSSYVAGFDGTVVALRAADGTRAWERALGHAVYSSACVAPGRARLRLPRRPRPRPRLATGASRFQAETRGPVLSSPVAIGARLAARRPTGTSTCSTRAGTVLHRLALARRGHAVVARGRRATTAFVGGATGLHASRSRREGGPRIPGWLGAAVLDRYHSGASHLFLLHGNIRDVHPFGAEYVGISEGVRRLADARAVVVSYDVGGGLSFPDAAREKAFRKALGLKAGPLPGGSRRGP